MNRASSWTLVLVATALLALLANGCSEFDIKNKQPLAVATAVVGGMPVMAGKSIDFSGSPVAVTLSSTSSKDPDGSISRAVWLRTDVTSDQRFGLGGAAGAGASEPFAGDPPAGNANPVVMLGEGKHRFSLWVVDNDGMTSAPSTLNLVVKVPSNYMPDAACMAKYPNPNKACAECVCSPMASKGCLELYKTCYENSNAEFSMLCDGITKCAIAGKCVGSACFAAAPLCQTQITAAAMYMGGTLSAERCAADATDNPCAASSKLGACTNFDAAMMDGNCRAVCKF